MFNKNKWKKIIGTVAMAGWMLVLAPLTVSAAEGDKVILNPADGNIQVKIMVDHAAEEKITGVSVVLHVDVTRGKEAVTFAFADGLSDAVTGSRYKDGNLYLYVASDCEIFQADDQLELGSLSVRAADAAQGLTAHVSYSEGTLQTVNKAYGEKTVTPGEVSDPVAVDKDGAPAPTQTPAAKPGSSSGSGSGTKETASPIPEAASIPTAPAETVKPQGTIAGVVTSDDGNSGNVDQGGIHDLFDDGSVLVEQSPATQEAQKQEPDTISAPEESKVDDAISHRDIIIIIIIGIIALIAIVIAELWWKEIKGKKE